MCAPASFLLLGGDRQHTRATRRRSVQHCQIICYPHDEHSIGPEALPFQDLQPAKQLANHRSGVLLSFQGDLLGSPKDLDTENFLV